MTSFISTGAFEPYINLVFAAEIVLTIIWLLISNMQGNYFLEHNGTLDFLILINILFALNTFVSILYNSTFTAQTVMEMVRFLLYAGLLFILYHFMGNMRILLKLTWVTLAASFAIASYSYFLAFKNGLDVFFGYGWFFLHSANLGLSNANTVAIAIAGPLPILISLLMFGNKGNRRKLIILSLIYIVLIWISWNSRSSYVFLFSSLIVLLLFHRNRWKFISIATAGIIIVFILVATDAFPLIKLLLRLESGLTYREDLWKAATRMIYESPLFGKGPDYFDKFKYFYMEPGIGRLVGGNMQGISPHNVLLMRAVDMGIGAAFLQLLLWFIPVYVFIKNARKLKSSEYYYLYLASGAIWIGMIFRSIFDTGGGFVFSVIQMVIIFRMPQLILKKIKLES